MWYPAAVSAPSSEPVTLTQAKAHLRVDHSDDDTLITAMIKAARSHIEAACATRFAQRTSVALKCDGFADFDRLPEAPVSAAAVSYIDTAGSTQTLPTTVYELRADGLDAAIVLKIDQSWPAIQQGSRITVTATVGYTTPPEEITHSMLMLVAHWYDNRATVNVGNTTSELPFSVNALICNYRRGA